MSSKCMLLLFLALSALTIFSVADHHHDPNPKQQHKPPHHPGHLLLEDSHKAHDEKKPPHHPGHILAENSVEDSRKSGEGREGKKPPQEHKPPHHPGHILIENAEDSRVEAKGHGKKKPPHHPGHILIENVDDFHKEPKGDDKKKPPHHPGHILTENVEDSAKNGVENSHNAPRKMKPGKKPSGPPHKSPSST